jgi:hypothetical protein
MRNCIVSERNSVIAICESRSQAEDVLCGLQRGGFDMTQVSMVGRDHHTEEHVVRYHNTNSSVRHVLLWMVLPWLGFVAVAGLIVIASWLMLAGIAEGLGVLLGNRSWLGNSVTGILLLAGLGLGISYVVARLKRPSRKQTRK